MLDLDTLLDYVQEDCEITIYDLDHDKDIVKKMSIEEAREWAYNHSCEVCSFEPTPKVLPYDFGITFNVCGVEKL